MPDSIDFVLPWVDGNDPVWQRRKRAALGTDLSDDREERYRDWGLLRYWFRGVEAFTPWVHRVFFICDQEPPSWLNTKHSKLSIKRHEDFIPAEYLPTFSSHPIELNMFRIKELSEQFVYFNDDLFVLKPLRQTFFFKKGLPCDRALLNPLPSSDLVGKGTKARIFTIPLNNAEYLNRDFSFRECFKRAPLKWLHPCYGKNLIRNLMLCAWPRFVGFDEPHLPQAFLKTSFTEAWEQDYDIFDATSRHALRDDHDVNQWLIRHRQLAQGRFIAARPIRNAFFDVTHHDITAVEAVRSQKVPVVCLNDGGISDTSFDQMCKELSNAFQMILPQKSSFEK